jgi:AcrR family transcriptional regulator
LIEWYFIEMAEPVNPPPSKPRFPVREARARQTRQHVLAAASTLFVADGYGATSIQAIADEAGVAVQTVYAVFGNKRSILAELLDVAIAGDDEQVSINERTWMEAVFTAPTAEARLRGYAAAVRSINGRAGDLFGVLEVAAGIDSDLVDLATTTEQRRRAGARSVIDSVGSVGQLRPELSDDEAVDVLWLLNSGAVFRQLVRRAGWSPDSYQAWLASAMVRELLA